jgi:hypothetical protein
VFLDTHAECGGSDPIGAPTTSILGHMITDPSLADKWQILVSISFLYWPTGQVLILF